ncbi:MAG: DAK2 domain-containing protein [Chloroflexota bacterium]
MSDSVPSEAIIEAIRRISDALIEQRDYLTELDQAIGDGDAGIRLAKAADTLLGYVADTPIEDVGAYLAGAGMAVNRAAPSTLGTLTATALMSAGKMVKGQNDITLEDTALMFEAAAAGIQRRGKASLDDKTIVDAMHPAAEAYSAAVAGSASAREAGQAAASAAEKGRDRVTPLRSKIGRASWVGERTEGKVDPGCAALVIVLRALVDSPTRSRA